MTGLVLHSFAAGAMAPDTAAEITALNAVTASAGLSLSQAQATALAASRVEALASTGRIEFGHGVTEKLILAFYTSPYLTKETYADTHCALTDLFYQLKNETDDRVGDGILFTLRVRVLDSSGDLSVSIVRLENSFCNAEKANVSATYVAGGIQKPVIDMDGDGRATVADVLIALHVLLDGETVEADVNRDGKFSLADIILLLKLCANGR